MSTLSVKQHIFTNQDTNLPSPPNHVAIDAISSRKRRKFSTSPSDEQSWTLPKSSVSAESPVKIVGNNSSLMNTTVPLTIRAVEKYNRKNSFATLHVHPWLVASLAAMAIKRPTGIQSGCIPEILKGRDCIGGSRTGSGKTIAFLVPILQTWAEDPVGIFAVILTPTRYTLKFSSSVTF